MSSKQIKDFTLKNGVTGNEDVLIQDGGITKRVKAYEFLLNVDLSKYYTKEQVDTLIASLGNKDEITLQLANYYDKATIDTLLRNKANDNHFHSISDITNLQQELDSKSPSNHAHLDYATKVYVTEKIDELLLNTPSVDLSGYATKDELNTKSDRNHNHDSVYATKTEVESLKQYVSNGKQSIADAITDKGVAASANDSWETLANKISLITSSQTEQVVKVTGIEVDRWDVKLQVGDTQKLNAKVMPSNATNQLIRWFTTNASVATVDTNGLVEAKGVGYSKITAVTDDGGYDYNIHINVSEKTDGGGGGTPTNSISVSPSSLVLKPGEQTNVTISFIGEITNRKLEYMSENEGVATVSPFGGYIYTVTSINSGRTTIRFRTSDGLYETSCSVTVQSSTGGGTGGGSANGNISNASETPISQQYSSSHEATPNNPNPPAGAYNWLTKPRINPDGSFPQSTWNAIGHWMTTYKVAGSSYYDNVGLLLQNPKMWVWNTATRSWDVLSDDFEWGTWYREDFWDDGSGNITGTTQWETGVSGNHSKWVKIKQTSETSGRCFHPWGYQKNWRNNSNWSNNGQPYIVTKIDFKLVKWSESGTDNLDEAKFVVNSGADWWKNVGDVWQPDWSTNRDMAVGKYILATRELKRAWCTNVPNNWNYGFPVESLTINQLDAQQNEQEGIDEN